LEWKAWGRKSKDSMAAVRTRAGTPVAISSMSLRVGSAAVTTAKNTSTSFGIRLARAFRLGTEGGPRLDPAKPNRRCLRAGKPSGNATVRHRPSRNRQAGQRRKLWRLFASFAALVHSSTARGIC
jgi:hypothetical protein